VKYVDRDDDDDWRDINHVIIIIIIMIMIMFLLLKTVCVRMCNK